jgi:hypothetical protein
MVSDYPPNRAQWSGRRERALFTYPASVARRHSPRSLGNLSYSNQIIIMKTRSLSLMLACAVMILSAGCATHRTASTVTPAATDAAWEYWSFAGAAGAIMPGMQMRLQQGWEIVTLSVSGPASDPYGVVVMRRPKH